MTAPIYLNALGIACTLGSGAEPVRAAMAAATGPSGGELTDRYTPGRMLHLGTMPQLGEPSDDMAPRVRSRNNAMIDHLLAQIRPAVDNAVSLSGPTRVAVVIGTSTSGIREGGKAIQTLHDAGAWPVGFHYAQQELGSPAEYLAMRLGLSGPAYTISTACSSGAKALASAARLLRAGIADAVIAGGADTLCPFTIGGFSALEAVSAQRCNPFSRNRAGINLGEGGALFLVSRTPGPVRLSGWGETSDAHHMSAPEPGGKGAAAAMAQALARAGLSASDIDYLNLHGTATAQNDAMESLATEAVLGLEVPASSTKPLTGHTLGAAGALEAGLLWLGLVDNPAGRLPPHWWDGERDPALPPLCLTGPADTLGRPTRHMMSNSFAFGGSNISLILSAA
ncbi:MAG: beta-ketoacyl-ACP synthase [Cupriavidus sp.]|nr:beta-ketoacyl-ACP synthase [Cupriavidus sp.]